MQKVIQVAVAVICYQDKFLLGFRNANQHQGNRYEFVGGKIEPDESPKNALIREVQEEIGVNISENLCKKMGVISHDYTEKTVSLHIFQVEFNHAQYQVTSLGVGSENQTIVWVEKADLLANQYHLPDANARILDWLALPNCLLISKPLQEFADIGQWQDFYAKSLPKNAWLYVRPKTDWQNTQQAVRFLQQQRADITLLIAGQIDNHIYHLNHTTLMNDSENLPTNRRYFASCHDEISVKKANQFAKTHCLLGVFISPVKNTPTHPDVAGIGWQGFADLALLSDVPVFALGGMVLDDLPMVWQLQGFGVAGIRLLDNLKGNKS